MKKIQTDEIDQTHQANKINQANQMNQSNQTEVRFAKEYEVYGIVRSECACPPAALQTRPHTAGCPAPSTRMPSPVRGVILVVLEKQTKR